jgi:hypothetical protein
LLFILAGVCLAGGAFVVWDHNRAGVTRRNYQRVREGMTLAEVVALLGGLPDEGYPVGVGHLGRPLSWEDCPRGRPVEGIWIFGGDRSGVGQEWFGDVGMGYCSVLFDKDERVAGKAWYDPPPGPFLTRLRRKLGL